GDLMAEGERWPVGQGAGGGVEDVQVGMADPGRLDANQDLGAHGFGYVDVHERRRAAPRREPEGRGLARRTHPTDHTEMNSVQEGQWVNKVALVTGAGSGIGAAVARKLAATSATQTTDGPNTVLTHWFTRWDRMVGTESTVRIEG